MITLLILVSLISPNIAKSVPICPNTQMVNTTRFEWNAYDRSILKQAKTRCVKFYPESPCVVTFKKYGPQDYGVLCGAKR